MSRVKHYSAESDPTMEDDDHMPLDRRYNQMNCHRPPHRTFIMSSILQQILYILVLLLLLTQTAPNVAARRSARIQYKTTYACEHRELHLDCEPNESIHLVRANYGRFSLSICNDGGRLDLSVMCMSYRSFLIMTDRCSNKSNCSVVVSSKLFGDPCPGTPKYLEVQYHCVRGGVSSVSSSSQATRRPPVQLNIPLLGNNSVVNYPIESAVPTTSSPAAAAAAPNSPELKNLEDAASVTTIQNNVLVTTVGSIISKANWTDTDKKQQQHHQSALHDKHHHQAASASASPSHYPPNNVPTSISSSTTLPPPAVSSTPLAHFEDNLNQFEPINQLSPPSAEIVPSKPKQYPPPNGLDHSFYSGSMEEYCPSLFVRSLFWNWTRKGEIATQKCPGGATGIVKWQCHFNPELGIAEWYPMRPDFSECRSLWLDNLEERLTNDEPVIRVANELALMTLTKPLYSEDLHRISRIIQQSLEHTVSSIQNLPPVEVWHRHQVLKELLMFIVETISNLLGNGQDDAWLDLNVASRKEVASALIKSLENSALLLAENTNHDGSSAIAKPNVLVSVHVLDTKIPISLQFPTYEDISGTNEWTRIEDSIFLPAQSLADHSHGGLAKVAFFAYYRIEDLLKPMPQTETEKFNSMIASQLQNLSQASLLSINSRVIGAAISRNGHIQRYPLSQPVTIVLRHLQEENMSSPQCVYWSMDQQNWLSDGCWVESTNSTHTVCMCNHLTHFALMSEIKSSDHLGTELKVEKVLVLSSCCLALLLFAFITVLIMMTPSGNLVSTSIHRNLCITLFMAEIAYLIGIYVFEELTIAAFAIAFLHYFLLATFFWTFFESFDIYMNINSIYEHFKSSRRLYWYYIFAYASPAFIVLICFMVDPIFYRDFVNFYLRMDNFMYFSFIGPSIGLILGSVVFVLFTYILTRNNTLTATTIKCFEDIRGSCSRGLIRWVIFLLIFQCINWSLAFAYLCKQDSLLVSIVFSISNVCLALFVCLFCIMKVENIQHSRIFRHLSLPFCHEDSQLSSRKNSTTSDVYSTRPVVTQVTSTQVNGINVHTPVAHSPSTPTATSPVSMSPCLPQPHPLPISHSTQWNYQPETLNCNNNSKKSTAHDHQSTLAHQDPEYLLYNFSNQKKEMKTLPREFNMFYAQEPLSESNMRIIDNALAKKRGKANCDFASLHRSKLEAARRLGPVSGQNENKYMIQGSNMLTLTPNMDHIYESIDSDSLASTLYDQNRRLNLNHFYGNNYRSKSTVNEDDLSSSSIYEDKPLLFTATTNAANAGSSTFWHDKSKRNFMPQHYHSNASIYDKAPKDRLEQLQQQQQLNSQALWQFGGCKDPSELPDLIQKQAPNSLLVSYSGENRFFNKVINPNQK